MATSSYSPVGEPEITFADLDTASGDVGGRKSFHSINIREVSDGHSNPDSGLPVEVTWNRTPTFRSSREHIGTEKSSFSNVSAAKPSPSIRDGSWTFELVSLLVSALAVGGIIGVLAYFQGRPLPEWPLNISLNSLIALLATIANANLAIPLQNGLSQLKWIRFKAGPAPLTDMEAFDDASRGTWGAIKLLARTRGGICGSFGAVIFIVALALGPFAQQVATYRSHSIEAPTPAAIPAALNYTGVLPGDGSSSAFVPILPMKSAVYYGLFSESNPRGNLQFNCPTGNCTWPEYTTLAVCSSCVDLTPYMSRYCANGSSTDGDFSKCGWQVPQGARLNSSADVFSMTSQIPGSSGDMPYTTLLKLIFMGTEAQNGPPLNYNPWAKQCTLQYCLQNFNSSVTNGALRETITTTTLNATVLSISNDSTIPVTLTAPDNTTYLISSGAMLGIRSWFSTLFAPGTATRSPSTAPIAVNFTVGISSGPTYFASDIVQTFYWDYYEYATGLETAMSDLATAMTVAFRSFNGAMPVKGVAYSFESYVHVRWGWITLPVLVVVLAAAFLASTMWQSRRGRVVVWKSSALAVLFCGIDDGVRAVFDGARGLHEGKRRARGVKVRLGNEGEDDALLRLA